MAMKSPPPQTLCILDHCWIRSISTKSGNAVDTAVWTGSLSTVTAAMGDSVVTTSSWIDDIDGVESDNLVSLYALSSVITVASPAPTPEPGTILLMPGAILLLWGFGRKRLFDRH
jgi:hypothetical protein